MSKPLIYLIGSLRNPEIPHIANTFREAGVEIFDDWIAAGPEADDYWRDYEQQRGHTYAEALEGYPAKHVFTFDEFNLNRCHGAILVYPAGKSCHLELGYVAAQGKPCFIYLDKLPDRYDVMKQFATGGVFTSLGEAKEALSKYSWPKLPNIPTIYQHEAMWLAGLWEGDGTFCTSDSVPRMVLQMTDLDVVQKAAKMLKSAVWKLGITTGKKQVWACGVSGLTAIEWMRLLKPYMGKRRQQQILKVASSWLDTKKYNKNDNPYWTSIFGLGETPR